MLYGIALFFITIIACFFMSAITGQYNDYFEMERTLAQHRKAKAEKEPLHIQKTIEPTEPVAPPEETSLGMKIFLAGFAIFCVYVFIQAYT